MCSLWTFLSLSRSLCVRSGRMFGFMFAAFKPTRSINDIVAKKKCKQCFFLLFNDYRNKFDSALNRSILNTGKFVWSFFFIIQSHSLYFSNCFAYITIFALCGQSIFHAQMYHRWKRPSGYSPLLRCVSIQLKFSMLLIKYFRFDRCVFEFTLTQANLTECWPTACYFPILKNTLMETIMDWYHFKIGYLSTTISNAHQIETYLFWKNGRCIKRSY